MKDQELVSAMWRATHSQYGIAVTTTSPDAMRRKFYQVRKLYPEMRCLSTILPPTGNSNEVWIIKRQEDADAPPKE